MKVFHRLPGEAQANLAELATQWRIAGFDQIMKQLGQQYLSVVADVSRAEDERIAAAERLVSFRPTSHEVVAELLALVNLQTPPAVSTGIIKSLESSRSKTVGPAMVKKLPYLTPGIKQVAYNTLLRRSDSTLALIGAAESGKLSLEELALDQKQSLRSHPNNKIRERVQAIFSKGGTLPDANRQSVIEKYHDVLTATGDVARGRKIFASQCSKCHIHGEIGIEIGPNLTGMAVHPKEELLTHILDPSRDVEANFRTYKVVTVDGSLLTGMLASESKTTIQLIDTEGNRRTVLREDIEELVMSRKSVMPEGFEVSIDREAMSDLLEFLTQKGQFVPLNLESVATVISTKSLFYGSNGREDRIRLEDWKTKNVKGIPFQLIDPRGEARPNAVVLRGHRGELSEKMPSSVEVPCAVLARRIHFLGGVGGWSFPFDKARTVSMTVRLTYQDGTQEDHSWINGVHIADYFGNHDVPGSESAFKIGGRQIRYLTIEPRRSALLAAIELVRGDDLTAPIVFAITVER
jgi:putative heme-binding domain-containing protein